MKRDDRSDNLGYFKEWHAPMFEAMCRLHPSEYMNATTTFYGPMLYVLARSLTATRVMEIGNDTGWSSGFLGWAMYENARRYYPDCRFYGLDIAPKDNLQAEHDALGLPSTFIHDPKGSVHWLRNQTIFQPESLDLVFVDGLHQHDYVMEEIRLLYPLVKGKGAGYIIMHDVYSSCQKTYPAVISNPAWKFEAVRLPMNYGFAILRKMENYVDSDQWPQGDETDMGLRLGLIDEKGNVL